MLFSSIGFIYYFLPVVLVLYYLTPIKLKNITLLFCSLFFYFVGEPIYIGLLLFSTLVDYVHSLIIEKHRNTKKAKYALVSSIVMNMTMLLFFKYADFFIVNMNAVFKTSINQLNLSLPIGISFFTFQTMSYTIDVYRNEVVAQKSILNLATYITLFPQLIAGPIVRYKSIAFDLEHRSHGFDQFAYGVKRFVFGLAKKVIIANSMGEMILLIEKTGDTSVVSYWLIAIAYTLQIYYDFSGYSDMAIGMGHFFGFHFMENFNYPYISRTITEFWNRWHISLSSWFKSYIYIPLGGNRVSKIKWFRNILLVWLLTGFWHGAAYNFIVWGLFFGLMLILEKVILLKYLTSIPKFLSHMYLITIVVISFVLFRHEDLKGGFDFIENMFSRQSDFLSPISKYYLKSYWITFVLAILGSTPLYANLVKRHRSLSKYIEPLLYLVLLLVSTGYLVDASFNPFLYFRF